jgi:hypothetical protein
MIDEIFQHNAAYKVFAPYEAKVTHCYQYLYNSCIPIFDLFYYLGGNQHCKTCYSILHQFFDSRLVKRTVCARWIQVRNICAFKIFFTPHTFYLFYFYSSPSYGSSKKTRENLAQPLGEKIFFAGEKNERKICFHEFEIIKSLSYQPHTGEATNIKSFMTMHGAMESGEIAANRAYESLLKPHSKM